MCGKILAIIFVLIALVLAILGTVLPPERIDFVVAVSKFFDIMLPVLAVGALLKFLCKSVLRFPVQTNCACPCCNKNVSKNGTCSTNCQ